MRFKKSRYYIHAAIVGAVALFGISSFIIYYDIIGRSLQTVIRLEADPSFTGGRIASVLYDPVGDDHGFGSLDYPESTGLEPGSLDLLRYTVHEPVFNAKWSDPADYWQLDLDFNGPSASFRNIRIYIDSDGDGNGSTVTQNEFAEGVEFDPGSPWDYVLSVRNHSGTLTSADRRIEVPLRVSVSRDGKQVTVRVPLAERTLQALYEAKETRHYVCVGAWDPWGKDEFFEVPGSTFTPNLFDILVSGGESQEALLSAWDEEEFIVPVLYPVAVAMKDKTRNNRRGTASDGINAIRLQELEKAEAEENGEKLRIALVLFDAVPADIEEMAVVSFQAGKYAQAEKLFDHILEEKPGNPVALAYKGSLTALRGGKAPPLAAVGIIAEAYTYLDRAVSLAQNPGESITAWLNRANVSKAVPDQVFGKALQGAEDFLAAAGELIKLGTNGQKGINAEAAVDISSALCNAAVCFMIAGKAEEAGTWFREAERMLAMAPPGAGASVRLELYRRYGASISDR